MMKALQPFKRFGGAFYIIAVDLLLAGILVCVLASYTSQYAQSEKQSNIQSVENLNRDCANLYETLFNVQINELKSAVSYCGRGLPESDMLEFLQKTYVASGTLRYQLIRSDFTGSCVYDAGRVIPVDYSGKGYEDLRAAFAGNAKLAASGVYAAPEFTDPATSKQSLGLCARVPIIIGGSQQPCTLLCCFAAETMAESAKYELTTEGVSSTLIASDGSYVLSGDELKAGFSGSNFVDFIAGANGFDQAQSEKLKETLASGFGSFAAKGADGEEKYFSFSPLMDGAWLAVTLVPAAAFKRSSISFELSIIIGVFLLIVMAFNLSWLGVLMARLRESVKNEKAANQAKSAFLSRMSHDMRTPLNSILNYSNFIADTQSLDEAREHGSNISIAGQYLLMLINDTLGMSRIESGTVELKPEPYDYSNFENNMKTILGKRAEDKGVELKFVPPETKVFVVMLDRLRVQQIVINLLNNSIKFTPPGGSVSLKTEMLEEYAGVYTLRFQVRDTGIGMSREFVKNQLFLPFAQEKRVLNSHESGGTGLGLSITKSIVELMGGTITCESEQNVGSLFTVTLPHIEAAPAEEKRAAPASQSKRVRLDGKRVLICEDNAMNRNIAVRLLKSVGCDVLERENGELGVEAFAASAVGSFSVILMDIRMPVMDGLEAARAIRALDRADARTVPIIAMSANAFDEDIQASLNAGMQEHLAKPIEPARFFRVLSEYTLLPESGREN